MNKSEEYPIPAKTNIAISLLQIAAMIFLLWTAGQFSGWWLFLVALGYGLMMNSGYAMLHEAEHGILHPSRCINNIIGVFLALFFPAPFHLLRQGHLGHHMRNRSDDEAFDFYFEGESPVWKWLQLFGILTGLFWLVIVVSNVLAAITPGYLKPRTFKLDRPTEALFESLNKRFLPLIWIESVMAILLHTYLIWLFGIPLLNWFTTLAGFGFIWSAMQYAHHFGTNRDVMNGALNLRTWRWLDMLWLNHNWHLRHHQRPTIPWVYLPFLDKGAEIPRGHLILAYIRMWRGPRLTQERVENRYAGRIIR